MNRSPIRVWLLLAPLLYGWIFLAGVFAVSKVGPSAFGTYLSPSLGILSTNILGIPKLTEVISGAMSFSQLAISMITIGMIIYIELSDPSYDRTKKLIEEFRSSCLAPSALLVILFVIFIFFKFLAT